MSKWRGSTWGQEISLEYGKGLRGYSEASGPYRVYGSNGPVGWTSEPLALGPGVILGRKGAYRGVRFSPEPFYVIDTAYYVVSKTDLDMRWLYYAIIHHKLGEIDDGSPIPSTTRSAVYVRECAVPSRSEQEEVASILGSLDDKIELNRRMNETLEAMAQAIFRDWFVDFGPTRRKLAGVIDPVEITGGLVQDLTRAAELALLFPLAIGDDGLPVGWVLGRVAGCAEKVQNGGTPSRAVEAYWTNGDVPWLTSGEVRQAIVSQTQNFISLEGMKNSSAKMVPARSILVALYGATAGQVSFNANRLTTNQAVCAVIPKVGWRFFLLILLRTSVSELAHSAVGSAQQNISKGTVDNWPALLPTSDLASGFDKLVEALFEKIIKNDAENQTLANTRDLLLPKLMSGEIRLHDAEKMVEEAV